MGRGFLIVFICHFFLSFNGYCHFPNSEKMDIFFHAEDTMPLPGHIRFPSLFELNKDKKLISRVAITGGFSLFSLALMVGSTVPEAGEYGVRLFYGSFFSATAALAYLTSQLDKFISYRTLELSSHSITDQSQIKLLRQLYIKHRRASFGKILAVKVRDEKKREFWLSFKKDLLGKNIDVRDFCKNPSNFIKFYDLTTGKIKEDSFPSFEGKTFNEVLLSEYLMHPFVRDLLVHIVLQNPHHEWLSSEEFKRVIYSVLSYERADLNYTEFIVAEFLEAIANKDKEFFQTESPKFHSRLFDLGRKSLSGFKCLSLLTG